MLSYSIFILMLISLGNLLYFVANKIIIAKIIAKIITSTLFVLIAISSYQKNNKTKKSFNFILTGLLCSLVGDVMLSISHSGLAFVIGLLSFSIAHIFYSISFSIIKKITTYDIIVFVLISLSTTLFLSLKDGFNYGNMYPLVLLYIFFISFMVAKALSLLTYIKSNPWAVILIISGAILFFLSDFVMVYILYYKPKIPGLFYINLITYYLAQAFFGLSFKKPILNFKENKKLKTK